MTTLLAMKLLLVPMMIALVTLASRRWGLAHGSWLAGLPITGGPTLVFLAIDQGMHFAGDAAIGGLVGTVSFACFCLTYGWSASRWPWWAALGCASIVYAAAIVPVGRLHPAPMTAFAIAVATVLGTRACLPRLAPVTVPAANVWELPLRMAVSLAVVLGVTGCAHLLGPRYSGTLTTFPTVASILGVFLHRSAGTGAVITLFRGLCLGMLSYAVFMLVVASRPPCSLSGTFAWALAAALLGHIGMLLFKRLRERTAAVPAHQDG